MFPPIQRFLPIFFPLRWTSHELFLGMVPTLNSVRQGDKVGLETLEAGNSEG